MGGEWAEGRGQTAEDIVKLVHVGGGSGKEEREQRLTVSWTLMTGALGCSRVV